jgi:hypothetical protein
MASGTVGSTTTQALQDAVVPSSPDYAASARGEPNLAGPLGPGDSQTAAQRNAAANAARLARFAERDLSRLADMVAFLLVGYGRAGQWTQIARGRLLAGGRKPWLGLAFGQLLTGP